MVRFTAFDSSTAKQKVKLMGSTDFDAIVIGAGSAGSVIARRLVDAGQKVAVIEAGGHDTNPVIGNVAEAGGAVARTGGLGLHHH